MIMIFSILNFLYFSSSSLTKKTLSFILMVVSSTVILSSWAGSLLMLLYIGGLFIVLTYVITFSFFQEKMSILWPGGGVLVLFSPSLMNPHGVSSYSLFEGPLGQWWVGLPLLVLVGGLLLISVVTPTSKSVRGGF